MVNSPRDYRENFTNASPATGAGETLAGQAAGTVDCRGMSLFGGHAKHPNLTRIAESLGAHLGLTLVQPANDVIAVLDQMTNRDLLHFDNLHSVEGMQELFRARSIRAIVDPHSHVVSLFVAVQADLEQEIVQEHAQRPVLHIGDRHATQSIVRPKSTPMLGSTPAALAKPAAPTAPLPHAVEHLEALEQLAPQIVDLFVRDGRLNTADKEVLKQIRPVDSSIEARLTALERWQAEVGRRVRGLHVQRATTHLLVGAEDATQQVKPEEVFGRRFDALTIWVSKLIKAFEHTGVKFHAKPMWLPH